MFGAVRLSSISIFGTEQAIWSNIGCKDTFQMS